jgi:pimeloyl-ACP methyl ester carboxylesterase
VAVERGAASRGVLVALTGGPGQSGVPFLPRIAATLMPSIRGWRLVMLDERGTGQAALRCPRLQRARGASDLTPAPRGAVAACARALGPRRRFFTTADTVADLEALRVRLHIVRITLLGVSYGTFVAERYALAHPRHVRALVLDSVVPQEGIDLLVPEVFERVASVLRAACSRCQTDPARDLAAVVRRYGGGPELLDALVSLSVGAPSFARVPAVLHRAAAGDEAPLRALEARIRAADALPAAFLSQALHQATLCAESRFPWGTSAAPLAGRRRLAARAAAKLPVARLWPFDRRTALHNGFLSSCLEWPSEDIRVPPASGRLPSVPTLMLAGARDLSTPLGWSREELRHAPWARLLVVAGVGHSVLRHDRSGRARAALVTLLAQA